MVEIRKSIITDADMIVLRADDLAEVTALGVANVSELLRLSIEKSEVAYTGLSDGKPICVFGCHRPVLMGAKASIWFLGGDEVRLYPRLMVRLGREFVGMMLERYDMLYNYVDARYTAAIRWLKVLGFKFAPDPQAIGVNGESFYYFELTKWRQHDTVNCQLSTVN